MLSLLRILKMVDSFAAKKPAAPLADVDLAAEMKWADKRIIALEECLAEFVRWEGDPFVVGSKASLVSRARRLLRKGKLP